MGGPLGDTIGGGIVSSGALCLVDSGRPPGPSPVDAGKASRPSSADPKVGSGAAIEGLWKDPRAVVGVGEHRLCPRAVVGSPLRAPSARRRWALEGPLGRRRWTPQAPPGPSSVDPRGPPGPSSVGPSGRPGPSPVDPLRAPWASVGGLGAIVGGASVDLEAIVGRGAGLRPGCTSITCSGLTIALGL